MIELDRFSIDFRVDADGSIGLGHLVRCLALGEMLQSEFPIAFHCRPLSLLLIKEIESRGFKYCEVNDDAEWVVDLNRGNCVVLDGYQFKHELELSIKLSGATLVTIDDLFSRSFAADLIINHSPRANSKLYFSPPFTLFALGSDYVLLRFVFLQMARKPASVQLQKKHNLFICFGGADPKNLTQRAVELACKNYVFSRICVITGASYAFKKELDDYIQIGGCKVERYHNLDADQIAEIMSACNIAIVPASGILLEVLSIGMKVISGAYIDNQIHLLDDFSNKGYVLNAGNFSPALLEEKITEALNDQKYEMPKLYDGRSDERFRKLFQALNLMKSIRARVANSYDLELTYTWAVNSAIRQYSFNQNEITREEHSRWFLNKINHPNCLYLLILLNDETIGSVRFDINERIAIISYHVDPQFHGKGFGLPVLKVGIEQFCSSNLYEKVEKIIGKVQVENVASIRIFEKMGFEQIEDNGIVTFVKEV